MSPLDRLGGMLLCPRATLAHIAEGGPGGFSDAATFALLESVLLSGPELARAALRAGVLGVGAALGMAASAVMGQLLQPALLGLGIAVVLTLASRGPKREARDLDLAAMCLAPFLAARAVDGALSTLAGLDLGLPLWVLGLGGTLALAGLAIRARRAA